MNTSVQNSPFKATGRISRITFIAWNIALSMLLMLPLLAISLLIPNLNENALELMLSDNIALFILLFLIIYIPFLYFSIIFSIKRLHDINQSGWLYLLSFVPLINVIFALYVVFASGTTGPNKFGEQRAPKTWESVVTWVIVGLFSLLLIVAIFAGVMMQ